MIDHVADLTGFDGTATAHANELLEVTTTVQDLSAFVATVARNCSRRHHRVRLRQPCPLAEDLLATAETGTSLSARTRAWLSDTVHPRLAAAQGCKGNRSGLPTPRDLTLVMALARGVIGTKDLARTVGIPPFSVRRALTTLAIKIRLLDVPPPDT